MTQVKQQTFNTVRMMTPIAQLVANLDQDQELCELKHIIAIVRCAL